MTKTPESTNTINTDCKSPTLPKEPEEFHKALHLEELIACHPEKVITPREVLTFSCALMDSNQHDSEGGVPFISVL